MKLVDFLDREDVVLELQSSDKDGALREMVELLDLRDESADALYKLLQKREQLGSTGIGDGVAIPHCRSHVVERLRVVYGRKPGGIPFDAIDGAPVHHLFLIVAPPNEISNQYLPVLGKVAQLCKEGENLRKMSAADSVDAVLDVLAQAEG